VVARYWSFGWDYRSLEYSSNFAALAADSFEVTSVEKRECYSTQSAKEYSESHRAMAAAFGIAAVAIAAVVATATSFHRYCHCHYHHPHLGQPRARVLEEEVQD